ncbi:MAG: hypothetical protein IT370_21490 [Deltaproteobacteria bacterium]|nr:hypothetical protein [Deltaproteobacteria bacterium]
MAGADAAVWSAISELLSDPDAISRALARDAREDDERAKWQRDLGDYTTKLKKLERKELEIFQLWDGEDDSSKATMKTALSQVRTQKRFLLEQIDTARRRLATMDGKAQMSTAIQGRIDALRARIPSTTLEEQAEIVRTLFPGRDGYQISMGTEIVGRAVVSAEPAPIPARPKRAPGRAGANCVEAYCSSA